MIMGSLYDYILSQSDSEPCEKYIWKPDTCKDCKYCEARRRGKFTSVFYCALKDRFVSPSSVKECFKNK